MSPTLHTPTDLLRQVRDLIADKDRWTLGASARSDDCTIVPPDSEYACQWCVSGAMLRFLLLREVNPSTYDVAATALEATCRTRSDVVSAAATTATIWVNDWTGHDAIVAAIDDTISLLGHDGRAVLCVTGVRADDDVGRLYIDDDGRLTVAWVTGDSTETVEADDLRSTRRRMIIVDDDSDDALFSRLAAAQDDDARY